MRSLAPSTKPNTLPATSLNPDLGGASFNPVSNTLNRYHRLEMAIGCRLIPTRASLKIRSTWNTSVPLTVSYPRGSLWFARDSNQQNAGIAPVGYRQEWPYPTTSPRKLAALADETSLLRRA